MKCPNCKKDPCICEETGEDKQYRFDQRFAADWPMRRQKMIQRRAAKRAKKEEKAKDE